MLDNASLRRLLVTLLAPVFVYLNRKFGIDIDAESQHMLIGLAITYVLASNTKEAVIAKAEAAGRQAALTVPAPVAPAVVLDRVAGPPASGPGTGLALVLAGLLALGATSAHAQPIDAPAAAGGPTVGDLRCFDAVQQERLAKAIVTLEAENASLKAAPTAGVPVGVVVILTVSALLIGGGAGAYVAVSAMPK